MVCGGRIRTAKRLLIALCILGGILYLTYATRKAYGNMYGSLIPQKWRFFAASPNGSHTMIAVPAAAPIFLRSLNFEDGALRKRFIGIMCLVGVVAAIFLWLTIPGCIDSVKIRLIRRRQRLRVGSDMEPLRPRPRPRTPSPVFVNLGDIVNEIKNRLPPLRHVNSIYNEGQEPVNDETPRQGEDADKPDPRLFMIRELKMPTLPGANNPGESSSAAVNDPAESLSTTLVNTTEIDSINSFTL
ncbi:uncharacterized protein TRIVIDRAFT_228568 [Trichoderma virens Gv29-8]|uniref:Uncharacterized protein n=1 Tax=Hypocrea virens (strain Gv29-8 / FGSC 10586) TaxID=413071 RepID=G9NCW9_HYPVG|nr:uncharacterized protein TRIVIDRAFT_228568 [Trichoderma virens Gv29-8]EHK15541.1 hypothetical protein TRIVIDRAFT_228568 [Trichoderma virens Gv29-8]UKZ77308.1 hypothetical protein TrVFT333_005028 [Trichoderma virens FT-333]